MRLILPTGPDGAERAYPASDLLEDEGGKLTLDQVIDLKRHTGMGLPGLYRGLGAAELLRGMPDDVALSAMSEHLELLEAYRALVWLVRYVAGDRTEDGSILTAEQAADFPYRGIVVRADPGDEGEPPDPQAPTPAAEPGGAAGKRGRSARTSKRKS